MWGGQKNGFLIYLGGSGEEKSGPGEISTIRKRGPWRRMVRAITVANVEEREGRYFGCCRLQTGAGEKKKSDT